MFDELFDNLTDRDRSRQRANSSGGFFGRIAQILGGEDSDDRRLPRNTRHDAHFDDRDEDERDDDYDRRHHRKRREFDFDLGD